MSININCANVLSNMAVALLLIYYQVESAKTNKGSQQMPLSIPQDAATVAVNQCTNMIGNNKV